MYVTDGMFARNGTTCVPKSVLRYVVEKVKLFCSELRSDIPMSISKTKVPDKSLSHELNNILIIIKRSGL